MLPRLPGSTWFAWLRQPSLRVGVLTGVYLSTVMIVSLLAANRVHFLEEFADVRNWISRSLFALIMLVPIGCFLRGPARLFFYSVGGWLLFFLACAAMGVSLERLPVSVRGLIGSVFMVHFGYLIRSPLQVLTSGVVGWFMFSVAYAVMGVFFERLHTRFYPPFHVFVLGVAFYGVMAVAAWVVWMAMEARHQPIAASRRRPR